MLNLKNPRRGSNDLILDDCQNPSKRNPSTTKQRILLPSQNFLFVIVHEAFSDFSSLP
jgi:hypothetical protein